MNTPHKSEIDKESNPREKPEITGGYFPVSPTSLYDSSPTPHKHESRELLRSVMHLLIPALIILLLFWAEKSWLRKTPKLRWVKDVPVPAMQPTIPPPISPEQIYRLSVGDTIFVVLQRMGVEKVTAHRLIEDCRPVFNLAQVSKGREIRLTLQEGQIEEFVYSIDDDRDLRAVPQGDGFSAEIIPIDYEVFSRVFRGVITSSLWENATAVGIEPRLLVSMSTILDWEIDLNTELQPGDEFALLVEEKHREKSFHHFGNILAAKIVVSGKEFMGFRYSDPDGRTDYYNQDGDCLRKDFLKAPLQFQRISSGYTSRRRHPILKIVRPHYGIDYAAPAGTPVRAVSDGVVIFAARSGGFGNFVRIRHGSSSYETAYGHLQGFARGIRPGVRVSQGQVIGYVGSTGLATGPHLDYRVYHNGSPINPSRIKTIPAIKLPKKFMPLFQEEIEAMIAQLYHETDLSHAESIPLRR